MYKEYLTFPVPPTHTNFFIIWSFLRKFTFGPSRDVNSSLDPGVDARTHGSKVTRLDVTDLGSEIADRAQQGILGDVDVAGTRSSEP